MNKSWFSVYAVILFSILYTPAANSQESVLIDKVIAKVGSEYILKSEVEEEFSYALKQQPGLDEKVKCDVLKSIIEQKVIIYQAKLDSIEINEEEVEQQLDFRFDAVLRQMNGDESFFKDYYGATVAEMKDRYRDDQRQKLLAEKMQFELLSTIEITPKEVEKFFESIPKDSLPYFKSDMEFSEIVFKPSVNEAEKQKAFDKITSLRSRIVDGKEDFATLATKYSQDPGSAVRGGDLGFAKRGSYVPEFEATVYALKKDEISEIIETEFGYHFIQLTERKGNSVKARHILIKPEITSEDLNTAKVTLQNVKTLIETDSLSFEKAVKTYSLKSLPSYSNSGRVKNFQNNSTFFAADELDADTYFTLFDLKPSQLSKVESFTLPSGEKAFRLLKLNSLSKPHRANLKEDYHKIATFAKESKKMEYFYNWIQERKREMYIYVDPSFNSCPELTEYVNP
ncbi:MAG: peptidylprolyl isomerase [Saprospiraceae bacterium]|nr:peptidylprolyl isomerase [Saprospiraceae bacterium]